MAHAAALGKRVFHLPGDSPGCGMERAPLHHNLCTGRVGLLRLLIKARKHSENLDFCLGFSRQKSFQEERGLCCTTVSGEEAGTPSNGT